MGEVINDSPEPPRRGSKPRGGIPPEAQSMDLVAQDQRDHQITAVKAFEAFGIDGKNYDLVTYTQIGRNVFQLHGVTGIVGGRILLVIKANEQHGTFLKAVEQMGVSYRTAARYMHTAKRFGKYDNLSHLNDSALAVLEELSDPELKKLDAGEDVLGLNLDAVDKMTAAQLRKRVRETKQMLDQKTKEYKEDVKKMSAELEELRLRSAGQEPPTKEQLAGVALEPLKKKLFEHLLEAQFHLDEAVNVAAAAQKVGGATFPQLQEWARAHYEQLAPIGELFEELDQALNNCGPDKPKTEE
jgi:hypothetical protein